MEGFNGWARPLDSMVRGRGYRLYNINNLKLARFKEIFPGAAKSDRIDTRKGLELFQLSDHLPLAKEVLQEVVLSSSVRIGNLRMRLPVPAKMALHTAGASGGTPGSPAPPAGALLGTMWTSTAAERPRGLGIHTQHSTGATLGNCRE